MVRVVCRTCGAERELIYGHPVDEAWCDDVCESKFERVVGHLVAGADPEEIGLDLGSRLCSEAFKKVAALRRREAVERREVRTREWERSRPRRLRPLYPV